MVGVIPRGLGVVPSMVGVVPWDCTSALPSTSAPTSHRQCVGNRQQRGNRQGNSHLCPSGSPCAGGCPLPPGDVKDPMGAPGAPIWAAVWDANNSRMGVKGRVGFERCPLTHTHTCPARAPSSTLPFPLSCNPGPKPPHPSYFSCRPSMKKMLRHKPAPEGSHVPGPCSAGLPYPIPASFGQTQTWDWVQTLCAVLSHS